MRLPAIAPILIILAGFAPAAEDASGLWKDKVQPLLAARCVECHGAKKAKHDLRLDSPEGIAKGGKELGPAIIAGKPDDSPLVKVCIMPRSEDLAMPPKGERLTAEELGWLKAWIKAGAPTK